MLTTKHEGGVIMVSRITRRELAHRENNGINVSLFWLEPTNRVAVAVLDVRIGEGFELEVNGNRALDAFHHPYAYAPAGILAESIKDKSGVRP